MDRRDFLSATVSAACLGSLDTFGPRRQRTARSAPTAARLRRRPPQAMQSGAANGYSLSRASPPGIRPPRPDYLATVDLDPEVPDLLAGGFSRTGTCPGGRRRRAAPFRLECSCVQLPRRSLATAAATWWCPGPSCVPGRIHIIDAADHRGAEDAQGDRAKARLPIKRTSRLRTRCIAWPAARS